jgi:hypothetical protein
LTQAKAWPHLERLLASIAPGDVARLAVAAAEARAVVHALTGTTTVRAAVIQVKARSRFRMLGRGRPRRALTHIKAAKPA